MGFICVYGESYTNIFVDGWHAASWQWWWMLRQPRTTASASADQVAAAPIAPAVTEANLIIKVLN